MNNQALEKRLAQLAVLSKRKYLVILFLVLGGLSILETGDFHQVTRTPNTSDSGVLHPHFSKDGKKLSWTERVRGDWRLVTADFVPPASLSNHKTFKPMGTTFYENHGFSNDGKYLTFTAGELHKFKTKVYRLDLETSRCMELAGQKYNESAVYTPRGQHIVWMTSRENKNRGTDYWVMDADGKNKRRITDFNNPKLKSFRRKEIISADHSFSPDGRHFAGYLQTDLIRQIGMTVIIELDLEKIGPL